ncbi:MAG: hypothetical protein A2Z16_05015 [Chloroflexi bacterium RBG_16_54_18]|nr:MAG: hypothetical protein A2Z16_05015 [Chloroflexi bacterium RBG_16_54_18]
MINKKIKLSVSSKLITLILITSILSPLGLTGLANTPPQNPTITYTAFLPLVTRNGNFPKVMGVETTWIEQALIDKANAVDAYWWRYSTFSWKAIEPNDVDPAQYNWSAVNNYHLSLATSNDFNIVAVVKTAPDFAQKIAGAPCGPIKDDAATIAEFQEFLTALAIRYSAPPYNIRTWQFGNEPDVSLVSIGQPQWATIPFGCWGDALDTNYYGGEYYGKFLQIFSETIKSVNPSAQVTNGGLLLSCHPVYDANCPNGNFFEGMIKYLSENNGLDALDYASFHSYTGWFGGLGQDVKFAEASPHPGVLLGKSYFLREVMSTYGINPVKPLLVTEGGLMCLRRDPPDTLPLPSGGKCSDQLPPPEFSNHQADYLVWMYVRAIADGISGVMWYTLNPATYRHVGLLYTDFSPKPAYIAYQFMSSQIGNAQYVGTLDQYIPTLQAYEFSKGSMRIWVLWAPDQLDHAINIPAGFQAAYDKLGAAINLAPGATTITINSPVYLILN